MSNYRRYSNRDLENMIHELRRANIINLEEEQKFTDAIFKRHHDKPFTSPEERREAQKRNALQYYYRNRLIKKYFQHNTNRSEENSSGEETQK